MSAPTKVEKGTIRIDLNGLGGAAIALAPGSDLNLYTYESHTLRFLGNSPANGSEYEQARDQRRKIQIRQNAAPGVYPFKLEVRSATNVVSESLNYLIVLAPSVELPDLGARPIAYRICPSHDLCN